MQTEERKKYWILFSEVSIYDKTLFLDLDSAVINTQKRTWHLDHLVNNPYMLYSWPFSAKWAEKAWWQWSKSQLEQYNYLVVSKCMLFNAKR